MKLRYIMLLGIFLSLSTTCLAKTKPNIYLEACYRAVEEYDEESGLHKTIIYPYKINGTSGHISKKHEIVPVTFTNLKDGIIKLNSASIVSSKTLKDVSKKYNIVIVNNKYYMSKSDKLLCKSIMEEQKKDKIITFPEYDAYNLAVKKIKKDFCTLYIKLKYPICDAVVELNFNDNLFIGTTDKNGEVTFSNILGFNESSKAKIKIKRKNYKTVRKTIK